MEHGGEYSRNGKRPSEYFTKQCGDVNGKSCNVEDHGGQYRISCNVKDHCGHYILIRDEEDPRLTMFDKPLPCFGCGIGWFSLLLGCVCPLMWYYATILYFIKYYHRDPRERSGLAANAIAALIFTMAVFITVIVVLL